MTTEQFGELLVAQYAALRRQAAGDEDLVQATMLRAWTCREMWDGRKPLLDWLCRMMWHLKLDAIKEARARPNCCCTLDDVAAPISEDVCCLDPGVTAIMLETWQAVVLDGMTITAAARQMRHNEALVIKAMRALRAYISDNTA